MAFPAPSPPAASSLRPPTFVPAILRSHLVDLSRSTGRPAIYTNSQILYAPILPYLYLNTLHGRAQVAVMDVLRRGEMGEVTNLVALMPCHSTPWMSALHRDVDGWFLTCAPPLE